jgi:hypothetical protein
MTDTSGRPRRRRRRGSAPADPALSGSPAEAEPDAVAEYVPPGTDDEAALPPSGKPVKNRGGRGAGKGGRDGSDRGLRELVGNTPSQLGPVGALRGRDVNRPTDEDLAAAEQELTIVRRHWTPPK